MARIDRKLQLILPVERSDGMVLFAHSAPIESATFLAYYRPIAQTYAQLISDGLVQAGGVRVADLMLKEVSERMGLWADDPRENRIGVERGLLAEIRRLTNVFAPVGGKWEMVPLEDAVSRDVLSRDEQREAQAAAVFFTCASQMFPKQNLQELMNMALRLVGAVTSFSNATEFQNSLPTLTAGESSGATVAAWWETFSSGAQPERTSAAS